MRSIIIFTLSALVIGIPTTAASAQDPPPEEIQSESGTLRVFFDYYIDFDYLRREIRFINWVRDRTDADVHILGTSQMTGGGGSEYTFTFIGLKKFAGQLDTLKYVSRQTDTPVETREGQIQVLKMGLMQYVADTPAAKHITIAYESFEEEVQATAVEDPWNNWIFTSRIGSFFNGESQSSSYSANGSFSARRTTEEFKISTSLGGSYSQSEFKITDTIQFINISRSYYSNLSAVWSLGPHWSAGFDVNARGSTYINHDLAITIAPAIEYNIYPYSESSRREITFQYSIGPEAVNYDEETIYFKTSEVNPLHSLYVSVRFQEPWGSVSASVNGSQYLNDLAKHSAGIFGSIDIRIIKGLSLNLFASIDRIKNQIYLPREDLTLEEILLRRRQLGTDYMFFGNIGISYTFGSMYNNVVNPRM